MVPLEESCFLFLPLLGTLQNTSYNSMGVDSLEGLSCLEWKLGLGRR